MLPRIHNPRSSRWYLDSPTSQGYLLKLSLSTSSNLGLFWLKSHLPGRWAGHDSLPNEGLTESRVKDFITEDDFEEKLRRHLDFFCETRSTTQIVKWQNDFLKEGFEEAVVCKRPREGEIDLEFLERVFCDTTIPRVMANAKQNGKEKNAKSRKHYKFWDVPRY